VARLLVGLVRRSGVVLHPVWINGGPGVRVDVDGELGAVVSLAVEDGRITHVHTIANPHKLGGLDDVAAISRT
jgi:RNA polymerase sigma-70 factor (ECF subfamily)